MNGNELTQYFKETKTVASSGIVNTVTHTMTKTGYFIIIMGTTASHNYLYYNDEYINSNGKVPLVMIKECSQGDTIICKTQMSGNAATSRNATLVILEINRNARVEKIIDKLTTTVTGTGILANMTYNITHSGYYLIIGESTSSYRHLYTLNGNYIGDILSSQIYVYYGLLLENDVIIISTQNNSNAGDSRSHCLYLLELI